MQKYDEHPDHAANFEYSQITDHIIIGTNLCCTTKPHVKVLEDQGIDAEIDLEEERQESPPKINSYLWLPVVDKTAPNPGQLDVGVAAIDAMVKANKKIYVHCKYGHGRSPTLVAAYFISQGMSVEDAVQKIKDKRPEIHPEKVQLEALDRFAKLKDTNG